MTSPPLHAIRTLHHDLDDRPFIVIWELTRACMLACRHCRAEAQPRRHPGELSTDEGFAFLDDLAAYGPPRPIVVLTGGDPVERPDLVGLVAYGTSLGLPVSLAPSVTPRLTPGVLEDLAAAGAKAVSLSLDGATAATHDTFRGEAGVFSTTLELAAAIRAMGMRLQINTAVTAANVAELPAVLRRVVELDAGLWSVFFLVQTGRGESLDPLRPDEIEEVLHWLHEIAHIVPVKATEAPHFRRLALQRAAASGGDLDEHFPPSPLRVMLRTDTQAVIGERTMPERRVRPPLDVNAGRGFAFVDHLGRVQPSGFLPMSAGSIRTQPFSTIYREAALLRALRRPAGFTGRCGRCEFQEVCGGSRSAAHATTGDPLGEDPNCSYQPLGASDPRAVTIER